MHYTNLNTAPVNVFPTFPPKLKEVADESS